MASVPSVLHLKLCFSKTSKKQSKGEKTVSRRRVSDDQRKESDCEYENTGDISLTNNERARARKSPNKERKSL